METLQFIVNKNETKFYRKLSKYIEKESLSLFGTVIATLESACFILDCETV